MSDRLHRLHFAVVPPEVFGKIKKAEVAAKEKEKSLEENKNEQDNSTNQVKNESLKSDLADEPLSKYVLGIGASYKQSVCC